MGRKRTLSTGSSESDDPSYVSPRKFKALQLELAKKTQALFQSQATNEKLRKQIDFNDGKVSVVRSKRELAHPLAQ